MTGRAPAEVTSGPPKPSLRHRVEYWLYRIALIRYSILPEWLAIRSGAFTGWFAGVVLRIRRREVDAHLAAVFPHESPAWRRTVARASYMHLGREASTLVRMTKWSREELLGRVRFVDFDAVHEAAEQGRGVVLLTAHLGNWEVAGAGIAALGLPLDVVGKGMANRQFEADLFEIRERLGMRVIEMSDAPKGVLRSLGRGRVVAMLGDQNAHRNGIFLPFFGRPAATSRGPALFALRSEAPVFVGFAIRDPGWRQKYTLVAKRLEFLVSGDVGMDTKNLLLAYHRLLEEAIVSAPDQYFWQHKRWKTRPQTDVAPGP